MINVDDFSYLYDRDELLGANVTDDIIQEAIDELQYIATKNNVAIEDIQLTQIVKRYIKAYTYVEVAKNKSYVVGYSYNTDSGKEGDLYSNKLAIYREELKAVQLELTAETLTGKPQKVGYRVISLKRG